MKNPTWQRDELILALDLYFRVPEAIGSKTHPEVLKLSEILNFLPIHGEKGDQTTFRNPNGVGMKLSNFLPYDPNYRGKGLTAGGKKDEEIWNEFYGKEKELHLAAQSILLNLKDENLFSSPNIDYDEVEATEGRLLTKIHKYRERDRKIIDKRKELALKFTGKLECESCDFNFLDFYGDIGQGYIECHHEKPVSELKPGEKTKLSDLRIVCSNCHRMIHRKKPWLSVLELRKIINN